MRLNWILAKIACRGYRTARRGHASEAHSMPPDASQLLPSDDSGRVTFERYCYQAHIAFPFCLNCALGGDVVCVVAEHIEDIAVQFNTGWRFLQIKTRDLERGPWKLRDLTAKGGGLHSLLRSHRILDSLPATLELHVEGAVQQKDLLQKLLTADGRCDATLLEKLEKSLKIDVAECGAFAKRIRIVHSYPTRETIQAQNTRLLVNHAGHLPASALDEIYDRMLMLIYGAMQAKVLPHNWKHTFLTRGVLRGKAQNLFLQKQLLREHFQTIVQPLTAAPQPLLKRLIDNNEQPPTILEQKLIMGGASPDIIQHAKTLRAYASQREYELLSSQMYEDGALENVQMRLLIRAHGLVNEHGSGRAPAAAIWNALLQVLGQQYPIIDNKGLFQNDPDLLLGAICDLSDKCQTGWGIADA